MKKQNATSWIRPLLIVLCLFALIPGSGRSAHAACPSQLSLSQIWLLPYDSVTVSVQNPKARVKWSVSGSLGLKVKKRYGKYKQKIVLTSGNKTGSATLTATAGGTRLTCPVHVANGYRTGDAWRRKSKTVLKKVIKKKNALIVRVRMCNGSSSSGSYSSSFDLERYTGGKWVMVSPRKGWTWSEVTADIPARCELVADYRLSEHYEAKDLKKGTYRIRCQVRYPGQKAGSSYVRFKIK